MNEPDLSPRSDSVLRPFLYAEDEQEAKQHLDELIASAAPDIARITRASRTPEDAFQEAAHRIVRQLRDLRARRSENAIGNYSHYVKVVASRIVKGQVRDEKPRHRSLVDSLRHTLKREPSFDSWDCDGHKLCGLVSWRDQQWPSLQSPRAMALLCDPRSFEDVLSARCDPAAISLTDLLRALFAWIGHPLRFTELVRIVVALKRIEDFGPVTSAGGRRALDEWLPDREQRPDQYAEWKSFLERLWTQIEMLPPLPRLAYLLNFTSGEGQLEVFWTYGIASIRQIGAVLQITDAQFALVWESVLVTGEIRQRAQVCRTYDEKFALLWQLLPLPDALIACLLGADRQKVINLRRAASDRLARHMRRSDKLNSW
jgi:hypothetical protein